MDRLLATLREHKTDYKTAGFRWNDDQEKVPSSVFTFIDGPGKN